MLSFLLSLFSPTKLEKRAEQVLPGSVGGRGRWRQGAYSGEMAQTMCIHMNKCINNLKNFKSKNIYIFVDRKK
jgi:hypothetical protein